MEEIISVTYELSNGMSKEIIAVDVEQAIEIARSIYEQVDDCDYASARVNGEVVREWGW